MVINVASRIKAFKLGYEFSNPITYVQAGEIQALKGKLAKILSKIFKKDESIKDDYRITALNEMLREQNKSSKDMLLADSFKTCGLDIGSFSRMIMKRNFRFSKLQHLIQ